MDENLNEEEREKLRLENEIRKMKLELEKGAKFMEDPDMPSLPPEIENEFLNYIEQFEKMNADSPKVSVFEKIGSPALKKSSELSDEEVTAELEKIFELLHENSIQIDSIHEVDEREMFRFVTEDIFKHEVYEMKKLEGMMTHFTYEEFYPDDIKDVIAQIGQFFETFLDLADEENLFELEISDLDGINQWLHEFRNSYNKFEFHSVSVGEVQVHEDDELEAEAIFDISFDGYTNGKTEKHIYNGKGHSHLLYTAGGWMIQSITFPQAT